MKIYEPGTLILTGNGEVGVVKEHLYQFGIPWYTVHWCEQGRYTDRVSPESVKACRELYKKKVENVSA